MDKYVSLIKIIPKGMLKNIVEHIKQFKSSNITLSTEYKHPKYGSPSREINIKIVLFDPINKRNNEATVFFGWLLEKKPNIRLTTIQLKMAENYFSKKGTYIINDGGIGKSFLRDLILEYKKDV